MKCHALTHLIGEREPADCKQPVKDGHRYCYYHEKVARRLLTPSRTAIQVEDKDGESAMDKVTYYKVLSEGHRACHGGKYRYTPNRWTKRIANTAACERGYHITTMDNLVQWLFADSDDRLPLELWEVEAEGVTDLSGKSVAERIRLTRLVGTLDEYDLRWLGTEFACICLPNTKDPRVGECINTVRDYLCGMADANDLGAARSAAWSAAWSAAESAAWSAAESAAESAARSAAESAARSAARSAAESAARSAAESAAWSAAGRIVLDYLTPAAAASCGEEKEN